MTIKNLKAYVTLPYMSLKGHRAVCVPGFDDETSVFADFEPDAVQEVPDAFTRSALVTASRVLWEPWSHYCFATPHDRASMLAAVLTAVSRCSMDIAPGFLADAPTQGSGKTKLISALGGLIRGSRAPVTPWVSGLGSEAELNKKLVSLMMSGVDYLALDNVCGVMSSTVLSALMTDGALSERLLGGNVWFNGEARLFICATSNNATLDKDLSRRFIRIRIDTGVERPNGLTFPFDPVESAITNRMKIANSALQLTSAFRVAGAPSTGHGDGGFRQWNLLVRQVVLWIGSQGLAVEAGIGEIGDPAFSIVEQAGNDDPDTTALSQLLNGLNAVYGKQSFRARDLHILCEKSEHCSDEAVVSVKEALGTMLASRREVSSISIGRALMYRRGRISSGLALQQAGVDRGGAALWVIQRS